MEGNEIIINFEPFCDQEHDNILQQDKYPKIESLLRKAQSNEEIHQKKKVDIFDDISAPSLQYSSLPESVFIKLGTNFPTDDRSQVCSSIITCFIVNKFKFSMKKIIFP